MGALFPSDRSADRPVPFMPGPVSKRPTVAPLPRPLTPLIGRDDAVDAAVGLLHDPSIILVTLTGPGVLARPDSPSEPPRLPLPISRTA